MDDPNPHSNLFTDRRAGRARDLQQTTKVDRDGYCKTVSEGKADHGSVDIVTWWLERASHDGLSTVGNVGFALKFGYQSGYRFGYENGYSYPN